MLHGVNRTTGALTSSATCAGAYHCDIFDPEGALGWISAAWMTWLGLQAGRVFLLARGRPPPERDALRVPMITRWVLWGTVLGLLGGSLAGFSENGGVIPLNKNLWSPSFVLALAGVSFGALAVFFVTIDVFHCWSGAPFRYPGMNSVSARRCRACACCQRGRVCGR